MSPQITWTWTRASSWTPVTFLCSPADPSLPVDSKWWTQDVSFEPEDADHPERTEDSIEYCVVSCGTIGRVLLVWELSALSESCLDHLHFLTAVIIALDHFLSSLCFVGASKRKVRKLFLFQHSNFLCFFTKKPGRRTQCHRETSLQQQHYKWDRV